MSTTTTLTTKPAADTIRVHHGGPALSLVTVIVLMMGYFVLRELSGAWDTPTMVVQPRNSGQSTASSPVVDRNPPQALRPSSDPAIELGLVPGTSLVPSDLGSETSPLLPPGSALLLEADATSDGVNPLRVGQRPAGTSSR